MIRQIIYLFIILTTAIFPQDTIVQQFNYAKKLYSEEKYFDAVTECKRLIFFNTKNQLEYKAYMLMGESYKKGDKFSDAIICFTNAALKAKNDNELFSSKIEIVKVNILRRTTYRAMQLLDELQKDKRYSANISEINYWRGWTFIFSGDWEKASKAFSTVDTCKKLQELCSQVYKNMYSEGFSSLISHFIPGAGQIYTGNYFSGILSLGWNILWGYVTINSFAAERIFDGLVQLNLLWLRFYNGNIQNAKKFANEKNRKIENNALNYLQFQYNGLKP